MKVKIFVIVIIIIFAIFLYFYLRPTTYQTSYNINNIKIIENYNVKDSIYEFEITYEDIQFSIISLSKYTSKRNLIKNVLVENNEEEICLNFEATEVELYPICYDGKTYYSKYIENNIEFTKQEEFKNIEIDQLDEKTYMLWNYNSFIHLKDNERQEIKVFNNDIYNMNLIYKYSKYLILPDYEQNYQFNQFIIIDSVKGTKKELKLRYQPYFDSYFLGDYEEKIYLYDPKEEQEYYLDMKKEEIYTTKNQILIDGDWESVSTQKLKNNKLKFEESKKFEYIIKDNKLYLNVNNKNLLISSRNVNNIVETFDLEVYYLSEDTLYKFNPYEGEKTLIKYTEWNFNKDNMIYIFNN